MASTARKRYIKAMKIRVGGIAKYEDGCIQYPMSISDYPENRTHWIRFYNSEEDWNLQNTVPIKLKDGDGSISSVWIFKDYILYVPEVPMHLEDMKTSIKHFVLKREDKFQKMNREIERFERFERFEKLNPIYREQIPEEVRMYVWRRDQGKCVQPKLSIRDVMGI